MTTNTPPASGMEDYIKSFPPEVQTILQELRSTIRKAAPQAEETIGYGIPTFRLNGNLVHFGAYKNHIGFYPGAGGVLEFYKKLSSFKSAKGSVQFPHDRPIPYDVISKIVKFRVKQNEEKFSLKKSIAKK